MASSAYFGLPANVQFCSQCTISNQRPNSCVEFKNDNAVKETISFNDGLCDACVVCVEKHTSIDWDERDRMLAELCAKYRSTNGTYDCVVPSSGGKDSTMTAVLLKYKYGMNPLTVTWAPHLYTEVGYRNVQHLIHAGLDNVTITPNGKVHRLLTRLAFENLCHPFQPFIIGQRNCGPVYALLHKIPLVFYGENQAEYGNSRSENANALMAQKFFGISPDEVPSLLLGGVSVAKLQEEHGLTMHDLKPYIPPLISDLEAGGIQVHYLGYYVRWDPQEVYYFAQQNTGFEANPERTEGSYSKYSSIDDRIDGFHYLTTWIKFGIGRATYDSCQEVRNKKITREEAVSLVKKYDGEFPQKYFLEILEYIGMTAFEFFEILDKNRSPHLWRYDEEKKVWIMKHTVWGEERIDDSIKYAHNPELLKSNKKLIELPPLFD